MNNIFMFIGRITKDLELRYTKENKAVTEVSIAINNSKEDTTFVKVSYFGKIAETIHQYCKKGDLISVRGIIKNHNWEDKDKNKHYDYIFIGDKVTFLSTKSNYIKKEETSQNEPKNELKDNTNIYKEFGDSIEISDEDLAF